MNNVKSAKLFNIRSRNLVKIALKHFHHLTNEVFWDYSKKLFCWPAIICWMLDKNNVLIRGYHIHPLLIWPQNNKAKCRVTIDADYVKDSCPQKNTWEVLKNSDEGVLFELTTKSRNNLGSYHRHKLRAIFNFVDKNLYNCHIHFSQTRMYLFSTDYKKTNEWIRKERQSDKIIDFISKPYKNFFYRNYIWPLKKMYFKRNALKTHFFHFIKNEHPKIYKFLKFCQTLKNLFIAKLKTRIKNKNPIYKFLKFCKTLKNFPIRYYLKNRLKRTYLFFFSKQKK